MKLVKQLLLILLISSAFNEGSLDSAVAASRLLEPNIEACTACHGPTGISTNPKWPNIAGQHPNYFIKRLKEMKEKSQSKTLLMSKVLSHLSEEEMDDLAAYYAKMPLVKGADLKKPALKGQQLYQRGDFEKGITACISCHGPKGLGNAQAGFPVLCGQNALYTIEQLKAFKSGKRSNDFNHVMQTICGKMNQDDMEAVAWYIENLRNH